MTASYLATAGDPAGSNGKQICGDEASYMVRKLDSQEKVDFCETYRDKVVLVVNTASRCGYTYQYEGLETLYFEYRRRGLVVVGFPSNDFGNQEPGKEKSINRFCRLTYGLQFPMHGKTRVRGEDAKPLYRSLADAAGQSLRWNFHKYLSDREGRPAGSYGSNVEPRSGTLIEAIERLL
ncbi:MAG: glutathione peroxidase [Gammaproteobacteria bacterium]|nr:glutathione peroxidase [Gammaproteobacteria bacterium]